MTAVPFKVHLQRHKEPTFHRFSGKYTFDEFQSLIAHLWGSAPKSLVVEYQDDEGDRVRIGSQLEWEECIRLWSSHDGSVPVRIFARRHKREDNKPSAACVNESTEEAANDEAASVPTAVPCLPPLALPRNPLNVEPDPHAESEVIKNTEPLLAFECTEHKAVIDLLSLVFGCTATEILQGGKGCPSSAVRWSVNPCDPNEVHLDIDRQAIFRRAVDSANKALDNREYMTAERILRAALVVFPDNMLLEYNLSCALSLQGFVDDALVLLSLAMDHGYDNIDHIKADPDLVQLRAHPRFSSLIPTPTVVVLPDVVVTAPPATVAAPVPVQAEVPATAPAEEPVPAVPSSEVPPTVTALSQSRPEAPAPAEPLQPLPKPQSELPSSLPPAVRTLMSVFPGLSVGDAKAALQRAGGNVAIAVNSLLPH